MKYFILFLFTPMLISAQTVLLPTWVADSLIYETFKGRQCSIVIQTQQNEIESLGAELMHTGEALKLSESKSSTLESLVLNAKEGQRIEQRQFNLDKDLLKKKIRKRNLLILGESVVIVLLISTL